MTGDNAAVVGNSLFFAHHADLKAYVGGEIGALDRNLLAYFSVSISSTAVSQSSSGATLSEKMRY